MTTGFEAVIGLEVHCQLQTESKAFSPDSAAFGAEPNEHVDVVSLGHPGTLPVLNARAVEFAVRVGLATGCSIAPHSVLARKHYFYPDLPKGYQISQYETPICADGYLDVTAEDVTGRDGAAKDVTGRDGAAKDVTPDDAGGAAATRRIGITRIHIEEDAGKSTHDGDPSASLLDYNRCGVPLIEIVSEPDLRTPREAYLYVRRIRQIVRYLGICDGNMEEGSLRCDANVSIRPIGTEGLGTKTEVKNLNSFRNVERALAFEIDRQRTLVAAGGSVVQETLLWDADRGETRSMRGKEQAHDYRYFPDPDLPPIVLADEDVERIRRSLPELPEARTARYAQELGLPDYDATLLAEEREVGDYFEACVEAVGDAHPLGEAAKTTSNVVMTHVLRASKETGLPLSELPVAPERLAGLVALRLSGDISSTGLQQIFEAMQEDQREASAIAESLDLLQVSDDAALLPHILEVLDSHPAQVGQYLGGKTGLIGFLIGQVMRRFPGSADPQRVRELLERSISNRTP